MSAELKPAQEHELKIWPEYYDAVQDGSKPFEIRIDDRGFAVGDILWFREFDPKLVVPSYTGREMRWMHTISYIVKGACGLPSNIAVLGLHTRPTPAPAVGRPERPKHMTDNVGSVTAWEYLRHIEALEAYCTALEKRLPLCPPCDIGENTECVCDAELTPKIWMDAVIEERDKALARCTAFENAQAKATQGEWRPIEEAPKETEILIARFTGAKLWSIDSGYADDWLETGYTPENLRWMPLPPPPHSVRTPGKGEVMVKAREERQRLRYEAYKRLGASDKWRNFSTLPEMVLPVYVLDSDYMGENFEIAWRDWRFKNGRKKPPTHWGWKSERGWISKPEKWMPKDEAEAILNTPPPPKPSEVE